MDKSPSISAVYVNGFPKRHICPQTPDSLYSLLACCQKAINFFEGVPVNARPCSSSVFVVQYARMNRHIWSL